jgi:hypothetical protein
LQDLGEEIGVLEIVGAEVGDGDIELVIVVCSSGSREEYIVKSDPVGLRTQETEVFNPDCNKVTHLVTYHHSALRCLPGTHIQEVTRKLAGDNITNTEPWEGCHFQVVKSDFEIVRGEVVGAGEVDVDG